MSPFPPAAPAAQAAAPQQAGGAQQAPAICVQMQPDGTYLVYSDDQGPDSGQPASDINTALQLVKQMLTGSQDDGDGDQDGQGGAPDGDADDAAEAMFQSGFKGARSPMGQ